MINSIQTIFTGWANAEPSIICIDTTDSAATILTTGYLNNAADSFGFVFSNKQMALVYGTDGVAWYEVVVTSTNISLEATISPGTVILPVTNNHFACFSGTTGALKDFGYRPSDETKTTVAMVANTQTVGRLALFSDIQGTVDSLPIAATHIGAIYSGKSGDVGGLRVYPATANKGYFEILAENNTGNTAVILTNSAHGQATTYTVGDAGVANGSILNCALAMADPSANLVSFDVTITAAALASGAYVKIIPGSGTGSTRFKFREIFLNGFGTNFSGGGGDRNVSITDGTNTFTVIPAATAQSLVNARWGSTEVPFPASIALNTSSVAGQSIIVQYSGGAADYAAGSLVISGIAERVA